MLGVSALGERTKKCPKNESGSCRIIEQKPTAFVTWSLSGFVMVDDILGFGDDVVVGVDGDAVVDHDEVLLVARVDFYV